MGPHGALTTLRLKRNAPTDAHRFRRNIRHHDLNGGR